MMYYFIIDGVQKWISPYIDDFRIITRWANEDYFKPYEVLKYGMKEFEDNNIEYIIHIIYKFFGVQNV